VRFSASDITELIMSLGAAMIAGSVLLAVLTAALRFGVKPLLTDWSKGRTQMGDAALERRVAELEEEMRQVKMTASRQLPVETPVHRAISELKR
jgi:hypothetical protein